MSWINGNGFIPNDGPNGSAAPWALPYAGASGPFPPGRVSLELPNHAGRNPSMFDVPKPA